MPTAHGTYNVNHKKIPAQSTIFISMKKVPTKTRKLVTTNWKGGEVPDKQIATMIYFPTRWERQEGHRGLANVTIY